MFTVNVFFVSDSKGSSGLTYVLSVTYVTLNTIYDPTLFEFVWLVLGIYKLRPEGIEGFVIDAHPMLFEDPLQLFTKVLDVG